MIAKLPTETKKLLTESKLDALLITKRENFYYLIGVDSPDSVLLLTKEKWLIFTSVLDQAQLEDQLKNSKLPLAITTDSVTSYLGQNPGSKQVIGFESSNLTYDQYQLLKKICSQIRPTTGLVEKLRIYKSKWEISQIAQAAQIADLALSQSLAYLTPGISEAQFAWILEKVGRDQGASGIAFDFVVAFGNNSAIAHYRSGSSILKANQPILLDFGFVYQGYRSDLSRSFFYGQPTELWLQKYQLVLKAQQASEQAVKLAVPCSHAHLAAEKVFKTQRQNKHFIHAIGHGVGLEIHEDPRLSPKYANKFELGQVFTLEPGLYYPGKFGIRIEDLYWLENKPQRLSTFPKNLKDAILNYN
jgi:Xaa-Pro aminopeptidase